jgi:cobalt-zinc-cadmium efflux system membrane fusion protein
MNHRFDFFKARWLAIVSTVILLAVVITAATYQLWLPRAQAIMTAKNTPANDHHGHDHHGHDHEGHNHQADHHEGHDTEVDDHAGHDTEGHDTEGHGLDVHNDANALTLSQGAWKNIGLKTGIVTLQNYVKTVSMPAIVVERPGRSQVAITAPITGIVTRVYPIEGEAIQPGQPLVDLRLTHEDLVNAQREFLQSTEELDVVKREIARLESVGEGVIAGRRVLEQKYEQQKLEAALHAQRQGLLLHGLSEPQIDGILKSRRLLPTLTVAAPPFDEAADHNETEHLYHVQSILIKRGQSVGSGEVLLMLADHCLLYIEGQAFEDDAQRLIQAAREDWLINVSPVGDGNTNSETLPLTIFHVADNIDHDSRALRFYLILPNKLIRDKQESGQRFVAWRFRPGQRMEVNIPLGPPWKDQIVLPPEAVVKEGAEAFVFEQHGNHFDRVPIHVVYRDKDAVVVENDGNLVGSTVAMSGAFQMQLAIKNNAGDGIDPHAGHTH